MMDNWNKFQSFTTDEERCEFFITLSPSEQHEMYKRLKTMLETIAPILEDFTKRVQAMLNNLMEGYKIFSQYLELREDILDETGL